MCLVWLTISKTLIRSIAMVNVRSGGQDRLEPGAIFCARGSRVDKVELPGRNLVSSSFTGWVKEEVCKFLVAEGVPGLL